MPQYFRVEFQAFPRLDKSLKKLKFKVRDLIKQSMRECSTVLIDAVQEALYEGDYIFKKALGGSPNIHDSLSVETTDAGATIRAEFRSEVNYIDFFEKGRKKNKFPSGFAYERRNIKNWLIFKKGLDDDEAEEVSWAMMQTLKEEDDAFRFPDPVIVPTLQKTQVEYEECIAERLIQKVEKELGFTVS